MTQNGMEVVEDPGSPYAGLTSRVLLVDDEDTVLCTLAAVLRQIGCEVQEASNPDMALEVLEGRPFDVLLADLRLQAESDGLELVAEARRRRPSMTCIIITGLGSLDSAISALRVGADDYLLKPCSIDDLKAAIRRHQRARADGDGARPQIEGELVRNVLHELRTPLTSIYGWAQVLERQALLGAPAGSLLPGLRQISESARVLRDAIAQAAVGPPRVIEDIRLSSAQDSDAIVQPSAADTVQS